MEVRKQENILKNSKAVSNFVLIVILLPLLLSAFTIILFGTYFETNDDQVMSMLISGAFQPDGGAYELSYFFYRYLVHVFEFLYSIAPGIPWYGVSLLFFNLAATINIFYVLAISLSGYFRQSVVTILLGLFFFTVVSENFIEINFTRTAVLLGGSSVIVLFILLNRQKGFGEWLWIGVCSLFIICSVLIRPMAGVLIAFLLMPFILYYGYKLKTFRYSVYFTIIMSCFVALLFISTQKFRPQNELDMIKYGSTIANIVDFDYDTHGQLRNKQDSLKKEAIKNFFVSDRKVLTDDFLNIISSDNYLASDKLTFSRFKASLKYTSYYLFLEYPGMTFLYFSVFLVILTGITMQNTKERLIFILLQIINFSSIILIHTIMKLPERLFVPLYGIFIVCTIFILFILSREDDTKRKIFNTIPYLFMLAFILGLYSVYNNYRTIKYENRLNEAVFRDISENCRNKSIILTTPSSILLGGMNPINGLQTGNNRIFPFIGWTTFMPSYYRELKKLCGSESINDFMDFVRGNPDYIFVSNEKFNDFASRYFLVFYGNEIKFQEDPLTPQSLRSRGLFFYKVVSK